MVKKDQFVNFIRDFAVFMEKKNITDSFRLMSKAHQLRPNGPFIKKKLDIYNIQVDTNLSSKANGFVDIKC
jgi:hypothetical protein